MGWGGPAVEYMAWPINKTRLLKLKIPLQTSQIPDFIKSFSSQVLELGSEIPLTLLTRQLPPVTDVDYYFLCHDPCFFFFPKKLRTCQLPLHSESSTGAAIGSPSSFCLSRGSDGSPCLGGGELSSLV